MHKHRKEKKKKKQTSGTNRRRSKKRNGTKPLRGKKGKTQSLDRNQVGQVGGQTTENVGPTFSSFNPCPSLTSVSTDDRKEKIYSQITKLDHYFWNSIEKR